MNNTRITLVAAVILTTISGCCERRTVVDAWPSTPLSGDLRPLQSELVVTSCIPWRIVGSITWIDANGREYKATALAKDAAKLMTKHGFDTARVDSTNIEEFRAISSAADLNPMSVGKYTPLFRQTAVLISVSPVVVAVSDMPIRTEYLSDRMNIQNAFSQYEDDEFPPSAPYTGKVVTIVPALGRSDGANAVDEYGRRIVDGAKYVPGATVVGLRGGIIYGDRVPAGDGWITILSKGLTPEYRRVEVVVGEPVSLEVPGGRIELVRAGEMIEVIGVPRPN